MVKESIIHSPPSLTNKANLDILLTNWLKAQNGTKSLKWHTWGCAETWDAYEKDSLQTEAGEWHASALWLYCVFIKDLFWTEMNDKAPSRTNKPAFLQETCCCLWRNVHTKPTKVPWPPNTSEHVMFDRCLLVFSPCMFRLLLLVHYVIKDIAFIYFFNTEKHVHVSDHRLILVYQPVNNIIF